MDKIRRAFSNADGTPRTGLTVIAIPVLGGSQVPMPETSIGKSGIYASSGEIAHGTYKIQVNGSDTGDTQVVEPGLHLRNYPSLTETASIDRSLSEFVRLSSFLVDDNSTATHANMAAACALAASRGRTLIMDLDVETTSAITVSGNLRIDLAGRTLTLGGPITSTYLSVSFGRVVAAPGKYLRGTASELFLGVDFTGAGDEQIVESISGHAAYIACPGISRTAFSGTSPNWTGPIVIGCDASGTADRLLLGSRADKNAGNDRLVELQGFIDSKMSETIANSDWLSYLSRKAILEQLISIPVTTRNALALGKIEVTQLKDSDLGSASMLKCTGGVVQAAKPNEWEAIAVAAGATYTPNGEPAFIEAAGNFTIADPIPLKACQLTVLPPSTGNFGSDIAITAKFDERPSMVVTFSGQYEPSRAIILTWSPNRQMWYSNHSWN